MVKKTNLQVQIEELGTLVKAENEVLTKTRNKLSALKKQAVAQRQHVWKEKWATDLTAEGVKLEKEVTDLTPSAKTEITVDVTIPLGVDSHYSGTEECTDITRHLGNESFTILWNLTEFMVTKVTKLGEKAESILRDFTEGFNSSGLCDDVQHILPPKAKKEIDALEKKLRDVEGKLLDPNIKELKEAVKLIEAINKKLPLRVTTTLQIPLEIHFWLEKYLFWDFLRTGRGCSLHLQVNDIKIRESGGNLNKKQRLYLQENLDDLVDEIWDPSYFVNEPALFSKIKLYREKVSQVCELNGMAVHEFVDQLEKKKKK